MLTTNNPAIYEQLERLGARLRRQLQDLAHEQHLPLVVQQIGSVIQLLWGAHQPVRTFADAMGGNREVIGIACEAVQDKGFYLSPRGLILICTEHTESMIDALCDALIDALVTASSEAGEA